MSQSIIANDQTIKSGYYDQLKYIVEPSVQEFESPGTLDTSGEHDNTVVPGLQHKYAQTGLLLVTERCGSYCRYCFRKRIVGKVSDESHRTSIRPRNMLRAILR